MLKFALMVLLWMMLLTKAGRQWQDVARCSKPSFIKFGRVAVTIHCLRSAAIANNAIAAASASI